MEFRIWPEKKSYITEITIGGETIEVKPLTLENSLRLMLLLSPYIAKIEAKWPRLIAALEAANGNRPHLLEMLFVEWRQDLMLAPGDLITAFSLLIDKDIEFVATRATAKDLVMALPVLDSVNDFRNLWAACKELGIVVKYG